MIFMFVGSVCVPSQTTGSVERLKDVKKIFVDESSFNIVSSSCGSRYGGMLLACEKHVNERLAFLVVLKRWLGKSGFKVVEFEDEADGLLRGTMSMNDYANEPSINDGGRNRNREIDPIDIAQWYIDAWMLNRQGRRIWTIRREPYPEISYGISTKAKVEGKKLAKAIQYDRKKNR
ncbi:MAG TPA: hypothetical protein PKD26_10860 [Pyrinomonadaceae bacterium]|nr:hypothetical protein [Pyrinomonadaceae bacterium]